MDPDRGIYTTHFTLMSVITGMTTVAFFLTGILPMYTNKFYFYAPSAITDSDVLIFKALSGFADGLLVLVWILTSMVANPPSEDWEDGDYEEYFEADEEDMLETEAPEENQ